MAAPPVVKTSVTILLGGDACPLALNLQFVAAKEPAVIGALPEMMQNHGLTETGLPFPKALPAILPFQAPWTRILIASVGDWTVLVNNSINGGDGTAPGPAIMDRLGVRTVVATHAVAVPQGSRDPHGRQRLRESNASPDADHVVEPRGHARGNSGIVHNGRPTLTWASVRPHFCQASTHHRAFILLSPRVANSDEPDELAGSMSRSTLRSNPAVRDHLMSGCSALNVGDG